VTAVPGAGRSHPAPGLLAGVRFLTVAEVALALRVSKMTVYRLVHSGELPAARVGRSFRVPEAAVRRYLHDGAVAPDGQEQPGPGPARDNPEPGAEATPARPRNPLSAAGRVRPGAYPGGITAFVRSLTAAGAGPPGQPALPS
jgi:excisionase family DNA binding protein